MALGSPQVIYAPEGIDSILSFRAGADLGFQVSWRHFQEPKKLNKSKKPTRI